MLREQRCEHTEIRSPLVFILTQVITWSSHCLGSSLTVSIGQSIRNWYTGSEGVRERGKWVTAPQRRRVLKSQEYSSELLYEQRFTVCMTVERVVTISQTAWV